MNRYSANFILHLVLWLVLALTPAACAICRDGDGGAIVETLGRFLANAFSFWFRY